MTWLTFLMPTVPADAERCEEAESVQSVSNTTEAQ